jgi:ketosteroid isomerase-like protein
MRFVVGQLVCLVAAAVAGCSAPADRAAVGFAGLDSAGLGRTRSAFQRAVLANDASRLAEFYADSAAFMVPGLPTLQGRPAIERFFGRALGTTRYESFEFAPVVMTGRGGVVSEVGHQQDVSRAAGKPPETAYGRYMITWVRSPTGEWRMMMDATVVDSIRPVAADRTGARQ